jgi:hypothetical protein
VTVGLAVLINHLIDWYPGFDALKSKPVPYIMDLIPFALAWCYGALGILSAVGLIGWAFDTTLWVVNWLGDVALWLGVGQKAGVSSHGTYLPLTSTGSCLVFLLTVAFIAFRRKKTYAQCLNRGVLAGLCLATSSGVAGLAAVPLAQAVNWLGDATYGTFT